MTAPSAGARFVLERRGSVAAAGPAADPGATASYDASIETSEATYRAVATLHDDGTVELTALGEPAPAELTDKLQMFARLTARSAPARRADGVAVWPARVTRWRPR